MTVDIRFRDQWDHEEATRLSLLTSTDFTDAIDRTDQSYAQESDINWILQKFLLTGELPTPRRLAEYGDFTQVRDFETAMEAIVSARETFDSLPATLRERFGNNPHLLVQFLENPDNYEEAVKLGLLEPPEGTKATPTSSSSSTQAAT